jgi:hypothetical protein
MSDDPRRSPGDYIQFNHVHEAQLQLMDSISKKVDEKIAEINQEWPDIMNTGADRQDDADIRAIVLEAHIMQLQGLSDFTFDLAEHDNNNELLDLDSGQLLTNRCFEAAYSFLPDCDIDTALEEGMRQGTDDFLRLLAPEGMDKLECPEMCFYPYKKSALEGYFPFYQHESGSKAVPLPTILPNVSIYLLYPPNSDSPCRLIGRSRDERPTPPSSPR